MRCLLRQQDAWRLMQNCLQTMKPSSSLLVCVCAICVDRLNSRLVLRINPGETIVLVHFGPCAIFFAFWRPWEFFLVLERPCSELSYSGDHRKGSRLQATILGVWSRYNSLPPPAVTGYYWPPGHETFTFRPFTGETHRTQRESATFRLALFTTFFTAHVLYCSP